MNHETAQDLFDALSEPFPAEYISWRVGSTNGEKTKGMALAYVDARAVMDRLDQVCGPDGWQCNYGAAGPKAVVCNIGIFLHPGEWVWKADGAGETDVEAEKGMLSDAFKRAAVRWGVGRYRYDLKSPWVELEQRGRSYVIKEAEYKKLQEIHEDFANKAGWGLRAGVQAYKLVNQVVKRFVTSPADAVAFADDNRSMIAQLPVAMRQHLSATLDRVGAARAEAAE